MVLMQHERNIDDMSGVFGLFKNTQLAAALNVGASTVSEMKRRNNIPPQYWPALIDAAKGEGVSLTLEKMVELAKRRAEKTGAAA